MALRIAVIGCGHWGPNHIRIFSSLPGCGVVAIADVDRVRLGRVTALYSGVMNDQDYRRIIERPEVDAVVVATPTTTHYSIVRDALLAGKHVLCEKPLCETVAQAQELVDLASSSHRVLMAGHVFLFNAGVVMLKELLDGGKLGRLYYLNAVRTNLGPIRSDVNAAYDLAAHDVSIFNWLIGVEPEWVSTTGASFLQPGIEDVVFISLRYCGNVFASIQASWLSPRKIRHITMVGSQQMVTWDDLQVTAPLAIYEKGANSTQQYRDYGEFLRISVWDGDVRLPKVHLEEPLRVQDRHFAECIAGLAPEARSDGAFSLGVVQTLEAIHFSLQNNGAPVRLPVHSRRQDVGPPKKWLARSLRNFLS